MMQLKVILCIFFFMSNDAAKGNTMYFLDEFVICLQNLGIHVDLRNVFQPCKINHGNCFLNVY